MCSLWSLSLSSSLLLALAVPGGFTPSPADDCGLEDPSQAARAPKIAPRRGASPVPHAGEFMRRGPVAGPGSPGALAGKTIYLSAGHGFVWWSPDCAFGAIVDDRARDR